ncbi:MAG: phosphatidylinositol 4-kinase [Candidatus Jettenia sp.]|nr:MAG: phosphatidylinositol 4-kinase [Candidatus Jettenia sp.]
MIKQEDINIKDCKNNIREKGMKKEIFGSIKDKEIAHITYDRWMGGPRGPERITFKDGSAVIFKCDIRHYWMADNPDTPIREAIVYQIDKIVELGLVPKTMVIDDTINKTRYDGSVQEWIQDAKDGYQVEKFTEEQRKDFIRLKAFDFVIGNNDRHLGNILFTEDGKMHAVDNNACLIIDKHEDILSFSDSIIPFFSRTVVHDMPYIVDLIEKFYHNKNKILDLIDKYIHDNTELAKLMVESRINYLYKMIKKYKPFSRKYREWREGLEEEVNAILQKNVLP